MSLIISPQIECCVACIEDMDVGLAEGAKVRAFPQMRVSIVWEVVMGYIECKPEWFRGKRVKGICPHCGRGFGCNATHFSLSG